MSLLPAPAELAYDASVGPGGHERNDSTDTQATAVEYIDHHGAEAAYPLKRAAGADQDDDVVPDAKRVRVVTGTPSGLPAAAPAPAIDSGSPTVVAPKRIPIITAATLAVVADPIANACTEPSKARTGAERALRVLADVAAAAQPAWPGEARIAQANKYIVVQKKVDQAYLDFLEARQREHDLRMAAIEMVMKRCFDLKSADAPASPSVPLNTVDTAPDISGPKVTDDEPEESDGDDDEGVSSDNDDARSASPADDASDAGSIAREDPSARRRAPYRNPDTVDPEDLLLDKIEDYEIYKKKYLHMTSIATHDMCPTCESHTRRCLDGYAADTDVVGERAPYIKRKNLKKK
ncbi:hypothetical protein AURDEDRAFT_164612 [Auricularia subglabra TFB-10046 SS5]|nr:hypothetical protein AURDEDRAFT_164612 [Auricularia subglabra TFB-10046 SS5]